MHLLLEFREETSGLKHQLQQQVMLNKSPKPQQVKTVATATDTNYDESGLLARIYDLENSTSWKITAPLRKIMKLFRR